MTNRAYNLDSFYQLLKGRVFYHIDYTQWLLDCMTHATLPIQPQFSLVIHEFVSSLFLVGQVKRIEEDVISESFNHPISPTQVLLLLYLLSYHDSIIACRTEPKYMALVANSTHWTHQKEYSPELLNKIPIRYLLNYAESYQDGQAYKSIYPDLIALSANLYPELFDITSFLLEEGKASVALWKTKTVNRHFLHQLTVPTLTSLLQQYKTNALDVIHVLSLLSSLNTDNKEEYINIDDYAECILSYLISPCLDKDMDPAIVDAFVSTWEAFNQICPYYLWTATVNHLIKDKSRNYTMDDLIQDPNILFKSDTRIFRSEKILPLWLHILSSLRTTSKHRIWKRFYTVSTKTKQQTFNARNVLALTNAQDTMMLQLLLELCLSQAEDKHHPDTLDKSRRLICQFIHSIFIDGDREMLLAKSLHFQTYSTDLIPMVVDLIPSIYIVFSFIPELTRQPQLDKQVFGILMACYLCEKYPLQNYLMIAEKHVLPRLMKIAFPVPRERSPSCVPSDALVHAIPGFVHLARAFPHFGPTILEAFDVIAKGLPEPQQFIGQEGNNNIIILVLQLHKVLKDSRDLVQAEVNKMDQVNKITL